MEEAISNNVQVLQPISSQPVIDMILMGPTTPKARGQPRSGVFMAGVNYSFSPSSTHPIKGLITFFKAPLRQMFMPHDDALVPTLEVRKHLMKRILVYLGSAVDLLYLLTMRRLGYKPDNLRGLRRVLVGFRGSQTNSMRKIVLPVSAVLVTSLIRFTVINEMSSFNTILGFT